MRKKMTEGRNDGKMEDDGKMRIDAMKGMTEGKGD